MATRPQTPVPAAADGQQSGVEALADAVAALGDGGQAEAPSRLLAGVGESLGADVAVLTVPSDEGAAVRAVWAASPAVAAQLHGARTELDELGDEEHRHVSGLTGPVRAVAERLRADAVLSMPVGTGPRRLGVLEVVRGTQGFDATERAYVRLVASAAAVALGRERERPNGDGAVLKLVTDALATAAAEQADASVAELALQLTGARSAVVWRLFPDAPPERAAAVGDAVVTEDLGGLAASAAASPQPLALDELDGRRVVSLPVGRPAWLVLQLVSVPPDLVETSGDALVAFAARAGATLRVAERRGAVATELERTRGLLEVVAEANADLSVAQTIEPTLERITDLLEIERGAIYLREPGGLRTAAVRGVGGAHETIGERLLELALGPQGGPGTLVVDDAARDARFAGLRAELESSAIEAAVAAPLVLADGVTGLLVLFPPQRRQLSDDERALLRGVAAQVAAAVQNANLHERAMSLGADLEEALVAERQSARQLRALYEISSSFAQSLSLDRTVDAVARTVVELAEADVAAIHMPDERGETLVPRALHATEARLAPAVSALLERPQPLSGLPRRLLRARQPMTLDARTAAELEGPYELLVPFLEKGATAVVVPIATPTELLGIVTVVSLDPARPLARETAQLMLSLARQAALAVDNARLYQQQKAFADTMQRSLLPRESPAIEGLEIGAVYESSARVDVGGDLYDFLELEDGRLALVLGDVTGHGIDAAADMAMAKFSFRSLARDHEDPADLLAAANDVVCGEIAPGKFITLVALVVDGSTGELRAAAAGHPRPRIVGADGDVRALDVGGLALGVVPGQEYDAEPDELLPGAAVVLFTDGVIEARREGELFGEERLDTLLAERHALSAQELAEAILDGCQTWSSGELADDCAVVVVRRTLD